MTQFTSSNKMNDRVVYVRPIHASELPEDARDRLLYSIHDGQGRRIGVAPDRDRAFTAARENELQPVSVH